ncbi:gas vesicle protein [Aquabacter spiritensis]|uniref:Gas vesicle protein GvpO n=1 Tax=Aquabacter spiritensis TaxID=933073 RepID=A0A4R3LRB6_9HYPH|nr:gas vesicle protein [Aquabacter spiritensis]TCT02266.1 gas vesicle protein GvpO [Aquabacter spiritensis]
MATTIELIRNVKMQLQELTGFNADSVSDFTATQDGWEMTVNLLELKRIPASTDMLAAYRIKLDKAGNVTGYHRSRRYLRDQVMEETP